jgi:selenoprotein W-related protein|tara:strand:+ start:229 stop:357 length:129 start_codon:yes stop_codon:yes gene_type:complete
LIPGTGGVFELYVDDVLIYSKLETGRHTNEGEILQLMEKALS